MAELPYLPSGDVGLDGARVVDIRQEIDCPRPGTILPCAGKKKSLRIAIE